VGRMIVAEQSLALPQPLLMLGSGRADPAVGFNRGERAARASEDSRRREGRVIGAASWIAGPCLPQPFAHNTWRRVKRMATGRIPG